MTTDDERLLRWVRDTVERFVRARTDQDVDDVVQEALTRLLENRSRIEPAAWASYAVVTAGNLLRERDRAEQVQRRHAHRLFSREALPGPEEAVLSAEERQAIRRALDQLDTADAALLARYHGDDAGSGPTVASATAARVARARGRLRVAYLLTHTRVTLPTPRCQPVLEALSSGDRRRQERTGAARHLLACRTCAALAPALVERRRAIAGLWPLGWVAVGAAAGWQAARRHPARTAAGSATAVAALVAVFVLTPSSPAPAPEPRPAAPAALPTVAELVVNGQSVLPLRAVPLPPGPARATNVTLQQVHRDGFWVGSGPGQRVWVQLDRTPGGPPVTLASGTRVTFTGQAVPVPPGYAASIGMTPDEGAAELSALGVYLVVQDRDLQVGP